MSEAEFKQEFGMKPSMAGVSTETFIDENGKHQQFVILQDSSPRRLFVYSAMGVSTRETVMAADAQLRQGQSLDVKRVFEDDWKKHQVPRVMGSKSAIEPAKCHEMVKAKKKELEEQQNMQEALQQQRQKLEQLNDAVPEHPSEVEGQPGVDGQDDAHDDDDDDEEPEEIPGYQLPSKKKEEELRLRARAKAKAKPKAKQTLKKSVYKATVIAVGKATSAAASVAGDAATIAASGAGSVAASSSDGSRGRRLVGKTPMKTTLEKHQEKLKEAIEKSLSGQLSGSQVYQARRHLEGLELRDPGCSDAVLLRTDLELAVAAHEHPNYTELLKPHPLAVAGSVIARGLENQQEARQERCCYHCCCCIV